MSASANKSLTKRSVTVNLGKLRKVRRLIKAKTDSETVRLLVDKELSLHSAVKAAQALRKTGGLRAVIWR